MAGMLLSLILFTLLGFSTLWYSNQDLRTWLTSVPSLFQSATIKHSRYETHTLSEDPLVVYIPNFITPSEALQLVDLSTPRFKHSVMWTSDGKPNKDPAYRSSQTAKLEQSNKFVKEISNRAQSFPFYKSMGEVEPLVVQKYAVGNQYKDHYDWYFPRPGMRGNRESTFFVYIEANCTGGGTNFPRLKPPTSPAEEAKWCKYIDCDRPIEDGVTFKPILGNAIFWRNLKEGEGMGEGHTGTLHAGLPVTEGTKMGLNIFTWEND